MGSDFFGLKPENKVDIHSEIFDLCYFGRGFIQSDVYNMPTYLRRFYIKKLNSTLKEMNEKNEAPNKSEIEDIKNKIDRPKFRQPQGVIFDK